MAWTFKWLWDSSPNHDKLFNELEWLQIISNVEINGNKKSFVSITIFCKSRSCWGNWDENLWKISLISICKNISFRQKFCQNSKPIEFRFPYRVTRSFRTSKALCSSWKFSCSANFTEKKILQWLKSLYILAKWFCRSIFQNFSFSVLSLETSNILSFEENKLRLSF